MAKYQRISMCVPVILLMTARHLYSVEMADGSETQIASNSTSDTQECPYTDTNMSDAPKCCQVVDKGQESTLQPCSCYLAKIDASAEDPSQTMVWRCRPNGELMRKKSSSCSTALESCVCTCDPPVNGSSTTLCSCRSKSTGCPCPVARDLFFKIAVLLPLPDEEHKPSVDFGYSIIPAVELAVQHINETWPIIPEYYFDPVFMNAGCDDASKTTVETVSTYRYLLKDRHGPTAIFGPTCSEDTIFVIGMFDRVYDVPVFHSSTTPYKNGSRNAYGIVSSTAILIDTLIKIGMRETWSWENIAVFYEESREHYQDTFHTFTQATNALNISQKIGYIQQITSSQIPLAEAINKSSVRIVVVFSGKETARRLACIAGQPKSHLRFEFPIYQFIFVEKTLDDFLGEAFSFIELGEGKKYDCDEETLLRGLNGSVLLNQTLDSVDPETVTVSKYTAGQIKQQYRERLVDYGNRLNMSLIETSYAYSYYDAVWALALGYHILYYVGDDPGHLETLKLHETIRNNVSFQGVSNWIEFHSRGDQSVSNPVMITQIRGRTAIVVSSVKFDNLTYDLNVFVPEIEEVDNRLHISLAVVGLSLAMLLLIFTILCHILNIVYRNYPPVKANSPRLNHFIFLGCYLFLVAIVTHTVPKIVPKAAGSVLCNVDVVFIVIGYGLIVSTLLGKSWRTYRIFCCPFETTSFLKDTHLAIFISLVTLTNVLSFTPFLILTPLEKNITPSFDLSQWPPVRKRTTECQADGYGYLAIPLTIQLLLSVATIFLATLNRKIRHANFRSTQQIFVFVYVFTIIWTLGGSLLIILDTVEEFSLSGLYSIYVAVLVVTVSLAQCILILPMFLRGTEKRVSLRITRSRVWSITSNSSFLSRK